jgi:hypothetical protein
MKKLLFFLFICFVLGSCGQKSSVFESSTSEKKWEIMREHYMVPGAPVSVERPLPNVLSEREILLKAADYAIAQGVLDPSFYAYENTPELMNAKIETPVLVFDGSTSEPFSYLLTAVDDDGVLLAEVAFNSAVNTQGKEFEKGRGFGIPGTYVHSITKQEAAELIKSQFPDSAVSEPMAVVNLRLGDDPHSHATIFWYFTVSDNTRSAAGSAGEYIIDASIFGYRFIPGGVSNRAAISSGQGGSPHLGLYRMAKLDTPIRLFDKLNTLREAGGSGFIPSSYPDEKISFTPVPLR